MYRFPRGPPDFDGVWVPCGGSCPGMVPPLATPSKSPRSGHSRLDQSPSHPEGWLPGTSIVRPSPCWVTHKTRHMLTQNCLHVVSTMFTFCGWIIGDLPVRGRVPHSEERTKLIYDQEYEELVHRLENMLDLTLESPSYSMVSDISGKPRHCPSASQILEAPWTSGTAIGPQTRTKGILHGWIKGISRPGLVPTDPDLSPGWHRPGPSLQSISLPWWWPGLRWWWGDGKQTIRMHHRVAPVMPV